MIKSLTSKFVALVCLALCGLQSFAGTVTGQVQNAAGGPVRNGTFSFTLTAPATIAGTATVVTSSIPCYTDGNGNVAGEPDPLLASSLSVNLASGTLAAGTYFVKIWYFDTTGNSFVSPEASVTLTAPGTLNVLSPVKQPLNASGYRVGISTSSGTETLQGSVTGVPGAWGNFAQSSALISGSAMPGSNTTVCTLRFNDELTPSFTCYDVGLTSSTGANIPGYPQYWYLNGGSAGTINVGSGTPQSNVCQGQGVVYPQAIVSQPPFNATQTINGGLTITGVETNTNSNSIRFADGFSGSGTTQINNAENDCSTTNCLVIVPSTTSAGAGQSLASKDNITVWDLRGGASPASFNTHLHLNVKDTENGNVRQKMILYDTFTPSAVIQAGSSSASLEAAAFLEGNLSGMGTLEALNGTITVDSGATNSPSVINGIEGTAQVNGTVANTITDIRGGTFNVGTVGAGNITTATALYAQAPSKTSTGTITNAYAIHAEKPTTGTSQNYSGLFDGQVKIGNSSLAGGGGTAAAPLLISAGTTAGLGFNVTSGAADQKTWDFLPQSTQVCFRAVNDANSGANSAFCINRGSGFTINDMTFIAQLILQNKITTYNNVATAGEGVTSVRAVTSQKNETGADASLLSFTPPSAVGTYHVCISMQVSAQNTATLGWTATWTDSNGSAQAPTNLALQQTGVAAPALTFTAATNGNYYGCVPVDVNNAGTAIVVKTTFAGTSIAYKASATIERVQ